MKNFRDDASSITLDNSALIPTEWLKKRPETDFYVFNPAVVRFRDHLLLVYRVDQGRDKTPQRRVGCAICRLDEKFHPIPGSVAPLSDTIVGGGANHYDPRLLVFNERLFVYYNNNWDSLPNQLYLVELNPATFQPISAARSLILVGQRQEIEKNWILFEHDRELYAIYQIDPHVILRLGLDAPGPLRCTPVYQHEWVTDSYSNRYGAPRGGTPPIRFGDYYVSVFHSTNKPTGGAGPTPSLRRRSNRPAWWRRFRRSLRGRFNPVKYYGGVYAFHASPPFRPMYIRPSPVLRPDAEPPRQHPTAAHLTPRQVVFPCGIAQISEEQWIISYGVHDERCVLRLVTHEDISRWISARK